MRNRIRAAFAASLSIIAAGSLTGFAGGSPVTASDLTGQAEASLLPQSVIDAAIVEEQSRSEFVISSLPDVPAPAAGNGADTRIEPGKLSLTTIVDRFGGAAPAGRQAECLAGAVYFESRGEPLAGQLAVAEVILNRARSGRFPGSVCGVVFQPSQFSFVRGGGFPPIARSSRAWREAVAMARAAQDGMASSGVGSALYFHARRVAPGWRMTRVATVGNHVFYR